MTAILCEIPHCCDTPISSSGGGNAGLLHAILWATRVRQDGDADHAQLEQAFASNAATQSRERHAHLRAYVIQSREPPVRPADTTVSYVLVHVNVFRNCLFFCTDIIMSSVTNQNCREKKKRSKIMNCSESAFENAKYCHTTLFRKRDRPTDNTKHGRAQFCFVVGLMIRLSS